jgi:hypothetical protein
MFIWYVMSCQTVLLCYDIMQEDTRLSSTNKMIFSFELRMSNIFHVDLQQLGKNKVVFTIWI